jgi:hypothetical protein
MNLRQIDDFDVGRAVVVLDLPAGPVDALDAELISGFDPRDHGNVRMPAVVKHIQLFRDLGHVDLD